MVSQALKPRGPFAPFAPAGPRAPVAPAGPGTPARARRVVVDRSFTARLPFLMSLVVTVLSLICLPVIMAPATAPPVEPSSRQPAARRTMGAERWKGSFMLGR